jgi:hypothetical protein
LSGVELTSFEPMSVGLTFGEQQVPSGFVSFKSFVVSPPLLLFDIEMFV